MGQILTGHDTPTGALRRVRRDRRRFGAPAAARTPRPNRRAPAVANRRRPARRRAARRPSAPSRAASTVTPRATPPPTSSPSSPRRAWSASTRRRRRSSRGSPKAGPPTPAAAASRSSSRTDVVFSDGHPFTADDVLFAFEAAYDEKGGSVLGRLAAGRRQEARRSPPPIRTPSSSPFRRRSRPASASSTTCRSCRATSSTPRSRPGRSRRPGASTRRRREIVGLGPFLLSASTCPGSASSSRATRATSRKAPDGAALPYLDRLVVEIIPDQSAELLRLESGQLDMMTSEIAPEAYAPLKRAADQGRVKLLDLGVSRNADGLWFNLKPGALGDDPRAAWLQRDELRRAISLAVDRKLFADTVFFGAGVPVYGPETPANKIWYWPGLPQTPHDPAAAQAAARVDRPDRPQRRRPARGRAEPAGALHAADAEGTAEPRARRRGDSRRAEEDRPHRRRRGAGRRRGDRSVPARALRGDLLQRRQERSRSRHQSRLLVQLRQRARVEPGAEDAGHAVGTARSTS